jgi:cytochrome P450
MSPFLAHRDPALYERPMHFVPDRWERIDPSTYEYMPFGAGPRLCIGAQFAAQAIRIALAVILARFRFETVGGSRVDRMVRGITLGAKDGIQMRLTKTRAKVARPSPVRGDIHSIVAGLPS